MNAGATLARGSNCSHSQLWNIVNPWQVAALMVGYSRNFLIAALVLFLISPALAQTQDETKTYQLSGIVVNSITGKPIPRVLVQIVSLNAAILTGPEGDFSFDGLREGSAQIQLTKPGYFRPGQHNANMLPYTVRVGKDAGKVVLKLAPTAAVGGTILGNGEEPLEGVQVSLLLWKVLNGRRQLVSEGAITASDEDGNYRISGLVPGRYYLQINASGASRTILGAQTANGGETYPAGIYFPAGNDVASAEPLDLAAGQYKEANFSLKTVPSFRIAGKISNPGDWNLNPPMFVNDIQQPLIVANRFERQSGAFEFRSVPEGRYRLQLGGADATGHFASSFETLAVHSNLPDLQFAIRPGLDIPVVVEQDFVKGGVPRGHCWSRGSTPGDVRESDCSDYPAVQVEMHSLDYAQLEFRSEYGPIKDGFRVRGVAPGRYSVRATPMFGGYVQSLRCNGVDLLREPVIVGEGGDVAPIEVVLRDDGAMLQAKIPAAGAEQQVQIVVFPDPMTSEPQVTARGFGNQIGLGPLPPGTYKVFAFDSNEEFETSAETMAKYAAQAASVTVGANENASVVLELIHIGD